jgi:hypothetical protein
MVAWAGAAGTAGAAAATEKLDEHKTLKKPTKPKLKQIINEELKLLLEQKRKKPWLWSPEPKKRTPEEEDKLEQEAYKALRMTPWYTRTPWARQKEKGAIVKPAQAGYMKPVPPYNPLDRQAPYYTPRAAAVPKLLNPNYVWPTPEVRSGDALKRAPVANELIARGYPGYYEKVGGRIRARGPATTVGSSIKWGPNPKFLDKRTLDTWELFPGQRIEKHAITKPPVERIMGIDKRALFQGEKDMTFGEAPPLRTWPIKKPFTHYIDKQGKVKYIHIAGSEVAGRTPTPKWTHFAQDDPDRRRFMKGGPLWMEKLSWNPSTWIPALGEAFDQGSSGYTLVWKDRVTGEPKKTVVLRDPHGSAHPGGSRGYRRAAGRRSAIRQDLSRRFGVPRYVVDQIDKKGDPKPEDGNDGRNVQAELDALQRDYEKERAGYGQANLWNWPAIWPAKEMADMGLPHMPHGPWQAIKDKFGLSEGWNYIVAKMFGPNSDLSIKARDEAAKEVYGKSWDSLTSEEKLSSKFTEAENKITRRWQLGLKDSYEYHDPLLDPSRPNVYRVGGWKGEKVQEQNVGVDPFTFMPPWYKYEELFLPLLAAQYGKRYLKWRAAKKAARIPAVQKKNPVDAYKEKMKREWDADIAAAELGSRPLESTTHATKKEAQRAFGGIDVKLRQSIEKEYGNLSALKSAADPVVAKRAEDILHVLEQVRIAAARSASQNKRVYSLETLKDMIRIGIKHGGRAIPIRESKINKMVKEELEKLLKENKK